MLSDQLISAGTTLVKAEATAPAFVRIRFNSNYSRVGVRSEIRFLEGSITLAARPIVVRSLISDRRFIAFKQTKQRDKHTPTTVVYPLSQN